jgi:hypothetical protein
VAIARLFRSLVAQVALSFRLGRLGYPNEPAPTAYRPRLEGVERVVVEMRERGLLPSKAEGPRLVWRYVCYYIDVNTGQRMSGTRTWTIETSLEASRQYATAVARQKMLSEPSYLTVEYGNNPNYRLVCRSIGEPWPLPTAGE